MEITGKDALEALQEGNIPLVEVFVKQNGFNPKTFSNLQALLDRFGWIESITYPLGYREELAFFFKQHIHAEDMKSAVVATRTLINDIEKDG